ncbi:MAG: hypothetical protein Q7S72_01175 [Candidatus Taylorbacteria bacterium]|nr:hypothetical protein [Candidatus Taylorbacteria bacterium]
MNKKIIWGTVIAVIVMIGAGYYLNSFKSFEPGEVSTSDWKTYTNTKYGFEFKYSKNLHISSSYTGVITQADNVSVTPYTQEQLKDLGKEISEILISVSDKKNIEPEKTVSRKEILIDGIKAVQYDTQGGMLDTQLIVILFQKDNKYYRIVGWSLRPQLDSILSTFKFTN